MKNLVFALPMGLCLLLLGITGSGARPTRATSVDSGTGGGLLKLRIVDAVSRTATPGRIEILDADGKSYTATDALSVGSDCTARPIAWKNGAEAAVFTQITVANVFTGNNNFYSGGDASIPLPPGRYRIKAWKGVEYRAAAAEVVVEAGKTIEKNIEMIRWVNMQDRGWYGADGHLHISRSASERNVPLSTWMQAEDLQFANLLQWGNTESFLNAVQYAHGQAGVYRAGNTFLTPGQENPRTHLLGHTMIWGASSAIDFRDSYVIYKRFWDEAQRQGALAGYAHGGLSANAQNGLSVDLPQGTLSFIEILQGRTLYDVWYNILDTGFKMAPVAGTDYPCSPRFPGRDRFYTQIDGPVAYAGWLHGVRRGRTFVTNGPMLEFQIDGKGIGSEVLLKKAAPVAVTARVFFDPTRDDIEALELVENGRVIERVARSDGAAEIRLALPRHRIQGAAWLAVRASGKKIDEVRAPASLAHSGAIYVNVRGAPSLSESPRAKALARAWLTRLFELEARLNSQPQLGVAQWQDDVAPEYLKKNQAELLPLIRAAQDHFSRQSW